MTFHLLCWAIFLSKCLSASTIDLCIQGWMWCRRVAIWVSSFWSLESDTEVVDGFKQEKLGEVLPPRINSNGVVSVGSNVVV